MFDFFKAFSSKQRNFFVAAFLLFNAFTVAKIGTTQYQLGFSRQMDWGNPVSSVKRVFDLAQERQLQPLSDLSDPMLFHQRNPGMFFLIADLFQRAGATSPIPNQIFTLILWNIGALFFVAWIYLISSSTSIAILSIWVLLFNRYSLMYSSTIHMFSYQFVFMNAFLLFWTKFLETSKKKFLAWAGLSQFLLCQNYYMFYLSSALMGLSLIWHYRRSTKFQLWHLATLAVPILAFAFTLIQIAWARGSFQNGSMALIESFLIRTVDYQKADGSVLSGDWLSGWRALLKYPSYLDSRIMSYFNLSALLFFLGFWSFCRTKTDRAADLSKFYQSLCGMGWLWVLAGVSWNLLMIQHSFIHWNAVIYGYVLWIPLSVLLLAAARHWWNLGWSSWWKKPWQMSLLGIAAIYCAQASWLYVSSWLSLVQAF